MKSVYFILLLIQLIILNARDFVKAEPQEVKPEILSAVQNQIDKEKKFGYDNFDLLDVVKGKNKVCLIYSATNETFEPDSKFLSGYTVSKSSSGQWIYVGSKTISYSSEQDLGKIKFWAQESIM
jgi:hypothetical protein